MKANENIASSTVKQRQANRQDPIVEALFFPSLKNTDRYFEVLKSARSTIKLCFYALSFERTAKEIRLMIRDKDIKVFVILDPCMLKRYNTNNCFNQLNTLKNVKIRYFPADELRRMHHKYAIIDDRIVISGSLNLTFQGYNLNQEDVLIVRDNRTAKSYEKNFQQLWDNSAIDPNQAVIVDGKFPDLNLPHDSTLEPTPKKKVKIVIEQNSEIDDKYHVIQDDDEELIQEILKSQTQFESVEIEVDQIYMMYDKERKLKQSDEKKAGQSDIKLEPFSQQKLDQIQPKDQPQVSAFQEVNENDLMRRTSIDKLIFTQSTPQPQSMNPKHYSGGFKKRVDLRAQPSGHKVSSQKLKLMYTKRNTWEPDNNPRNYTSWNTQRRLLRRRQRQLRFQAPTLIVDDEQNCNVQQLQKITQSEILQEPNIEQNLIDNNQFQQDQLEQNSQEILQELEQQLEEEEVFKTLQDIQGNKKLIGQNQIITESFQQSNKQIAAQIQQTVDNQQEQQDHAEQQSYLIDLANVSIEQQQVQTISEDDSLQILDSIQPSQNQKAQQEINRQPPIMQNIKLKIRSQELDDPKQTKKIYSNYSQNTNKPWYSEFKNMQNQGFYRNREDTQIVPFNYRQNLEESSQESMELEQIIPKLYNKLQPKKSPLEHLTQLVDLTQTKMFPLSLKERFPNEPMKKVDFKVYTKDQCQFLKTQHSKK